MLMQSKRPESSVNRRLDEVDMALAEEVEEEACLERAP